VFVNVIDFVQLSLCKDSIAGIDLQIFRSFLSSFRFAINHRIFIAVFEDVLKICCGHSLRTIIIVMALLSANDCKKRGCVKTMHPLLIYMAIFIN
jgi:hypothetical protein